ncbi:GntR family transcriptional regulator [Acidiphilium sp. AL]|uniref:GntR family transcriptional regulator n=1 Tax=Acidiphilium iwatense TaxID=768198 RepID=A0ABS9E305_9PROT|nr:MULTISPECIES: GntR family transcriptional regulator [Acidiphilium]MCF3948311.1 GntR family transcriptional regulator [Acidiphilium iwatense]MCU4161222.1 GntR family transcriptional regulator [Acidiphilium sp. AL]
MDNETSNRAGTEFQPLYAQVKALITRRIGSGEWKPGALIPNEFQLAAEFNVSQGTVRKALMALEAERLIVRRQGRGTYVARHTREHALFHFFRIVGLDDQRLEPSSRTLSQKSVGATRDLAKRLEIQRGTALHCITRIRTLKSVPAIFERIYVPAPLMPDLAVEPGTEMIDEMYVIYQERYGITIAHASERIAAVAATAEDARFLAIPEATPLLEITRVARDVGKVAVELRISRYRTDLFRYAAELN